MGKEEGGRLRKAIKRMPREGRERGIRLFARKMQEAYPNLIGTSYPSIHSYLQGRTDPSEEFWEAAAELLDVNPEWLIAGVEPMSRAHIPEEQAARKAEPGENALRKFAEALQGATEEEVTIRLGFSPPPVAMAVIHKARRRLGWLGEFRDEVGRDHTGEIKTTLDACIGRALAGPLDEFGVNPELCDRDELVDYLVTVTTATARLVEHFERDKGRMEEARETIEAHKRRQEETDGDA